MSTLALLHGFTGAPASWDEVRSMQRTDVRVVAPACLGHADAADAPAATFDDEVDRLASLLEAEPAPRVLAGYSMGGRLALGLLARHPGLFARVVAIGAHPGLERDEDRASRRADDGRWIRLLEDEGLEAFVAAWQGQALFATNGRASASSLEAQRRARLGQTAAGLARSLRVCGLGAMPALTERLRAHDGALELVVGEDDAKFLGVARALGERLPRARVRVVPGAGHSVPLEAPGALARILEGILAGGGARAARSLRDEADGP